MTTGLCLRNKTNTTLWLYTEQTAPLEWVHLRPGESCDMPVGRVWYTVGASFDEPSATAAILGQLGLAFGVLSVAVLMLLPEPGSKAVVAYIVGALTAVGGVSAAGALLGVSNESMMKRTGVFADGRVMDITATLARREKRPQGEPLDIYTFRWEQANVGWDARHDKFAKVDIRAKRDLQSLGPVNASVVEEIQRQARADQGYNNQLEAWKTASVLQQHVHRFGGSGGGWSEVSFCPEFAHGQTGSRIVGVRVAADKFIDGIQVKYANCADWRPPAANESTKRLGIFNGKPNDHLGRGGTLVCEGNDYIESVKVKHDRYVCQLTFRSRNGKELTVGGRDGDGEHTNVVGGPGQAWVGFQLEGGAWVDRITLLTESAVQVAVQVTEQGFEPARVTIPAGGTVKWEWGKNLVNEHSVTFDSPELGGKGSRPQRSGAFEYTFDKAGSYDYHSMFVAYMKGTVVVS
ncbi:MAG TPA: cupredoxin domain-containing protein [Polyangiaceae bacterium]|nr:cupredoxin domain-containing protein [Polyangiaceae bacterium]